MQPWLKLLRPKQWIKNAFVFAPLFFAHQFVYWQGWLLSIVAAACFLCISCVVYIGNDLRDVEEDRLHPVKRNRPLAAGTIERAQAIMLGSILTVVAVCLMLFLPYPCRAIAALYVSLNLVYTLYLKRVAILDIFFIASCYVLRVLMGCYALQVVISPWIILTTFLLALFLGFGKRQNEMGFEEYVGTKQNLQHYSREFLDRLVTICGCAALITYAIYTAEIARDTGRVTIVYTVAFVAFGLFRYLQSIYVYHLGGEPESIIIKDRLQLANIALWLVVTLGILF